MPNVIETFDLTKRFSKSQNYRALLRYRRREDLVAVDGVTLQVRSGELFGLLGPNGAGKTTLVNVLCTLILPSEGHALVCGNDVVQDAALVKRSVGLINSQERSFFWRLTGRENLEFFAATEGLFGARARARIDDLIDLVGLREHVDRRFMNYSTGMRQKLAVARGLLALPPVLLLDEPTRSLDPASAHDLRSFIRETLVNELGCTVLLVTHRLEEAEELCDRVAIMNHGRLIACAPVTELKQLISVRHRYRLDVQGLPDSARMELDDIPGVMQLEWTADAHQSVSVELLLDDEVATLPAVMRSLISHGGDIQRVRAQDVSLEEAFIQLTRGDQDGS